MCNVADARQALQCDFYVVVVWGFTLHPWTHQEALGYFRPGGRSTRVLLHITIAAHELWPGDWNCAGTEIPL